MDLKKSSNTIDFFFVQFSIFTNLQGYLFVCLFGFNVAFNIICRINTVSGCDRELNAHSAASLWYQVPDTLN